MRIRFLLFFGLLLSAALLMVACTTTASPEAPVKPTEPATATATAVAPTATTAATPIAPPTATLTPTTVAVTLTQPVGAAIPDAVAIKQVAEALASSLNITATGTSTNANGIEGVHAFKLTPSKQWPVYWVAYTYGMRNFETNQNHVIAIYAQGAQGWQEVARQELKGDSNTDNSAPPDYLSEDGVKQVQIEPTHFWLQMDGGVGAHSGVFGLFSFDGKTLKAEATGFSSSPGGGSLKDINGDGIPEVLLDATDYYVFCYACGVRQVQYSVLYWDGAQLRPLNLTPLADSVPAALREFNDHLLTLAQAGLWKDALAALDKPDAQKLDLKKVNDPTLLWNIAYIRLNAEAKRDAIGGEGDQYPLLSNIFYGDFAAAVDVLRKDKVVDLFRPDSPLIVGTVAEGNEDGLADYMTNNINPALQVQPDLAPAYFLRGWAAYRKDPTSANALTDIQHAAALAPKDTLYSESVAYLNTNAGAPKDAQADEVAATLAASLGITNSGTTTNATGIEGVHAFKLDTGEGGQPLWLAHTYGLRNFNPEQDHVLAIYTPSDSGWQEVTRLVLKAPDNAEGNFPAPDYLAPGTVQQVQVESSHIWLQLDGGVGAHSGVFGLFSFDGSALKVEATNFTSSPGNNSLKDLNGDGLQEVILDATDYYIFCYACGVRNVQYNVLRWDETKLISVTLTTLPESAPQSLRELNDTAVSLAQAGLWKEALTTIQKAAALKLNDDTFTWNAAYIRLNAEAKRAAVGNTNDPYPLLSNLFYGDFTAAVDVMRTHKPAEIFSADTPLITGTVAAGFEDGLADAITKSVEPALKLRPDLAAAYFLRGWATFIKTKDKAAALADVQKAAQLAPKDPLFTESVSVLQK
ncbi:MAG: hypothetical protein U0350_03335 [Caldilineaceae bacterium]